MTCRWHCSEFDLKLVAVVTFAVIGLTASTALAQQPTSTPYPDATPAGEFRVEPTSGPVGTVVTLTGDLDQDIHSVGFQCIYRDTSDVGILQVPLEPARSSFQTTFEVPPMLGLVQRGGETRATLVGPCEFLATSSHKLLFTRVPFTVTAAGQLPTTGSGPVTDPPIGLGLALPLLVGVLVTGAALGVRRRSLPA